MACTSPRFAINADKSSALFVTREEINQVNGAQNIAEMVLTTAHPSAVDAVPP
jgi:hypothetical protein